MSSFVLSGALRWSLLLAVGVWVVGCEVRRVVPEEEPSVGLDGGATDKPRVEVEEEVEVGVDAEAPLGPELTSIRRAVPQCPADFSKVTDCVNYEKPPAPSIRRSMVRPRTENNSRFTANSERFKSFDMRPAGPQQTHQLPPHRTSMDGRLVTAAGHSLAYMMPENVDLGFQSYADSERRLLRAQVTVPATVVVDIRPQGTRLPQNLLNAWADKATLPGESELPHLNWSINWDLCKATDEQGTGELRKCRAKEKPTGPWVNGECYDLTLLHAVDIRGHWELRSLSLTLFAGGGKRVVSGNQSMAQHPVELWFYPRSVADASPVVNGFLELPPRSDYSTSAGLEGPPGWDARNVLAEVRDRCTGAGEPGWCRFVNEQKHLASKYRIYTAPGVFHEWDGRQNLNGPNGVNMNHSFLEPATTADGRVLFIQDFAQGLLYSYNQVAPCDASGFVSFKPLSMAWQDPQVNSKYGFARYPLRDTQGVEYPAGASVRGGYPWVDRKGNNLMFPAGSSQNGYQAFWVSNPDENWVHHGKATQPFQINKGNGVAVVVVGSWTRGKMVVLDNGLNQTDYSFALWGPTEDEYYRGRRFRLDLYRDAEPVLVRPGGVALVNSLESALNGYEAYNPLTPLDVVWTASSTVGRNAEVAFDEYLRRGAYVVAHMNAPLRQAPASEAEPNDVRVTFDNGFGYNPQTQLDEFKRTPRLQNAATRERAPTLELRGGALVLPLAEGGVQGRGVFLDGRNDHVLVQGLPPRLPHYVLSLWVDGRWPDPTATPHHRVLYRFGDGTRVTFRPGELRLVEANGKSHLHRLDRLQTAQGQYFHLALEVGTRTYRDGSVAEASPGSGGTLIGRTVKVYLNGTAQGSLHTPWLGDFALVPAPEVEAGGCEGKSQGAACAEFNTQQVFCGVPAGAPQPCAPGICLSGGSCSAAMNGTLVLGTDRAESPPVRGWFDELRVYGLEAQELGSSTNEEFICNLALGSLRRAPSRNGTPVCQQMELRHHEQVDPEGVGAGLDYPLQAYQDTDNCGALVHRRSHPDCERAAALNLADKPLRADAPRPDFSSVLFCQSCHLDSVDPIAGLRPAALSHQPGVPASHDVRRQPMNWLPTLWGESPRRASAPLGPFPAGENLSLDALLWGTSGLPGAQRVGPWPSLPD